MKINATLKKLIVELLGAVLFMTAYGAAVAANGSQLATVGVAATLGLAILITASISGGHLNPIVSIVAYSRKEISLTEFFGYLAAQFVGALIGIWIGLSIQGQTVSAISNSGSATMGELIGEWVFAGGLVFLYGYLATNKMANLIPAAVGLWILAGLSLTPSGAQANPAVSVALMLAGHPIGVQGGLIIAQVVGAATAIIGLNVFNAKAVKAKKPVKK
jgi:glycerol uptake facilitator-like aquaporin